MTKLYITRHGQTEWNIEGRFQGQKDSKLTSLGEKQAGWLGKRLNQEEIDIIISSSSGRAMDTAKIIRGDRDIEIIPNDNLREINFGIWEGKLRTDIENNWPEQQKNFWNFPHLYEPIGGETYSEVMDRTSKEVEKIISKYEGKNVLIVTHAVILKAIIAYLENIELKDLWKGAFMNSTCLNIVEIEKDCRNFILQGDISHYKVEEAAM